MVTRWKVFNPQQQAVKMNESLVKYLSGLIDADGSLSLTFKKYKDDIYHIGLSLQLASSDAVDRHGFIESLPEQTGMGKVYRYGKDKQFKTWKVHKRAELEMLLPRLIKHMVIKASHFDRLLYFWRTWRGANVSQIMCEEHKRFSQHSRSHSGPLKPKNHPTWAWLAGYLDGDGWYRYKYQKPPHNYWQMSVGAVAHVNDMHVLEFIQQSFGGHIRNQGQSDNVFVWKRNLGAKDASFALSFLRKVVRHSKLKKHKIEQMIHHHQQRLSVSTSAEEATV
jgi:hypothetical protein